MKICYDPSQLTLAITWGHSQAPPEKRRGRRNLSFHVDDSGEAVGMTIGNTGWNVPELRNAQQAFSLELDLATPAQSAPARFAELSPTGQPGILRSEDLSLHIDFPAVMELYGLPEGSHDWFSWMLAKQVGRIIREIVGGEIPAATPPVELQPGHASPVWLPTGSTVPAVDGIRQASKPGFRVAGRQTDAPPAEREEQVTSRSANNVRHEGARSRVRTVAPPAASPNTRPGGASEAEGEVLTTSPSAHGARPRAR